MKLVVRIIKSMKGAMHRHLNREKENHTIDFVYIVCNVHGFKYEYIK